MSDSIRLHPTKGLNPHTTCCAQCGKDGDEILLLGIVDHKYTCKKCGLVHYGGTRECKRCGVGDSMLVREEIADYEKIPSLCKECRDKDEEFQKVAVEAAKDGGVIYRCTCGREGVVKGSSELAKAVREKTKVLPPKLVGVELTECPDCAGGKTDGSKKRARTYRAGKKAKG